MKTVLVTLGSLFGVLTVAYGSINALDARYAPIGVVEDLAYSTLKKDLRDLRERISKAENADLKRDLEADLEALVDRLCRSFPNDRECKAKEVAA